MQWSSSPEYCRRLITAAVIINRHVLCSVYYIRSVFTLNVWKTHSVPSVSEFEKGFEKVFFVVQMLWPPLSCSRPALDETESWLNLKEFETKSKSILRLRSIKSFSGPSLYFIFSRSRPGSHLMTSVYKTEMNPIHLCKAYMEDVVTFVLSGNHILKCYTQNWVHPNKFLPRVISSVCWYNCCTNMWIFRPCSWLSLIPVCHVYKSWVKWSTWMQLIFLLISLARFAAAADAEEVRSARLCLWTDWSSPQLASPRFHPTPRHICARSAWSFIQPGGSTA